MGKETKVEETKGEPGEVSLEEAFSEDPPITESKVSVDGMLSQALQSETKELPPGPQTKTYTQDDLDTQLREKEKAYKGLQTVLSKKDQRIKELEATPAPIEGEDKVLELLIQGMRSKETFGESDPLIPQLEAELRTRKDRQKYETQLHFQREETNKAWDKISTQITDAGGHPNDEKFESVVEAFEDARDFSGKFDRAYTKLDRILSKSTQPKDEAERATAEKARKKLEEEGLLTTETGGPSAVSQSFQDFQERYIKGDVSRDEYEIRARKEGKLL